MRGGGGGGCSSPLKEGGGVWERGSRDRPIAEPLCGVPFYPILGPRDGRGYVGPQECRGYVAPTGMNSRRSLWGKLGARAWPRRLHLCFRFGCRACFRFQFL